MGTNESYKPVRRKVVGSGLVLAVGATAGFLAGCAQHEWNGQQIGGCGSLPNLKNTGVDKNLGEETYAFNTENPCALELQNAADEANKVVYPDDAFTVCIDPGKEHAVLSVTTREGVSGHAPLIGMQGEELLAAGFPPC